MNHPSNNQIPPSGGQVGTNSQSTLMQSNAAPLPDMRSGNPPSQDMMHSDDSPSESPIVIIIKAFLAIAAITMAALFVSFLFAEYRFEFHTTTNPIFSEKNVSDEPSGWLNESDIPNPEAAKLLLYDFTQPVPDGSAESLSYFDDTVFIGDSRTAGLLLYTKLAPYDFSAVGVNVKSIMEKPYIQMKDENGETQVCTLLEALEREKGNYKAIYFAMGLNELGWEVDSFMRSYREAINAIRETTDVPIYIQLIMPVTAKSAETTQFGITNDKAVVFNAALREYAAENELYLLDPTELFALEDGTLNPEAAHDGVHLTPSAYATLADYYRSHIVDESKYTNLPVYDISDAPAEGTPAEPSEETADMTFTQSEEAAA